MTDWKPIQCPACGHETRVDPTEKLAECGFCDAELVQRGPDVWDLADPSTNAARITREATEGADEPLPADVEAVWEAWSASIQGVDKRTRTLLRAAFEAGVEAATRGSAAELGRKGGLKGGKARAEKLSPERRAEIAKKAAAARWQKDQ